MRGAAVALPAVAVEPSDRRALDWLNFFLADVQGGVGPFLAIFLISSQHWNAGSAGLVLTVGGLATVAGSSPLGALVDYVRWKRTRSWCARDSRLPSFLGAFALLALLLYATLVPETKQAV